MAFLLQHLRRAPGRFTSAYPPRLTGAPPARFSTPFSPFFPPTCDWKIPEKMDKLINADMVALFLRERKLHYTEAFTAGVIVNLLSVWLVEICFRDRKAFGDLSKKVTDMDLKISRLLTQVEMEFESISQMRVELDKTKQAVGAVGAWMGGVGVVGAVGAFVGAVGVGLSVLILSKKSS